MQTAVAEDLDKLTASRRPRTNSASFRPRSFVCCRIRLANIISWDPYTPPPQSRHNWQQSSDNWQQPWSSWNAQTGWGWWSWNAQTGWNLHSPRVRCRSRGALAAVAGCFFLPKEHRFAQHDRARSIDLRQIHAADHNSAKTQNGDPLPPGSGSTRRPASWEKRVAD